MASSLSCENWTIRTETKKKQKQKKKTGLLLSIDDQRGLILT